MDTAIRRDAFQRAAVDWAYQLGDLVGGRVGDHGVVFLSASGGSAPRRKQRFLQIAERVRAFAKKQFGFVMHFGAAWSAGSASLPSVYQIAIGTAETALARGIPIAFAEPNAMLGRSSLRHLREQLARAVEEQPQQLGARFERYLETVTAAGALSVDTARGQLEAGFERMADPLLRSGALDPKSFEAFAATLDRSAERARTLNDLFAAYRTVVSDMESAMRRPVSARQDRSLRRAVEYVKEHYAEPLSSEQVARVAGFTRTYFSKLFRERERTTFEEYVQSLRVERAKQLLADTDLNVRRVAELSGFSSPQYLWRVFQRTLSTTPRAYREQKPSRARRTRGNARIN